MFDGRGGDRRMKWSTHKSLWWVSHSEEAFLKFALMGLVSLPIIIWAIIFLLVISRNELALLHSGDRDFVASRGRPENFVGLSLICPAAISGLMHRSKRCRLVSLFDYSSASCWRWPSGTSSPSVLAVLRSMNSSTFEACCTGRSAGLSPLRNHPRNLAHG